MDIKELNQELSNLVEFEIEDERDGAVIKSDLGFGIKIQMSSGGIYFSPISYGPQVKLYKPVDHETSGTELGRLTVELSEVTANCIRKLEDEVARANMKINARGDLYVGNMKKAIENGKES